MTSAGKGLGPGSTDSGVGVDAHPSKPNLKSSAGVRPKNMMSSAVRSSQARNRSNNGGPSSGFKGLSSSSKISEEVKRELSHHEKKSCHAPMMVVVTVGGMIPFIITTLLAWYVFNDNTLINIERIYATSQESIRDLVESRIDSVIDAEVEAFRTLYEGAVKVVDSGAFLEHSISEYSYEVKQKRTAFWTQTIAEAYHYRLAYFIYSCHGHIMGTGYNAETSQYMAYYTDVHVFEHNQTNFVSDHGTEYDEKGCTTADFYGVTSKELTHTKKFTNNNYWKNILNSSYEDHDTATYEDGRLRGWYFDSYQSDHECEWTLPYIYNETKDLHDYVSTISMKTYDYHENVHGLVALDISLKRLNAFIQELSSTFVGTYSIVLSNEQRVMAATDGDIIRELSLNGEQTSQLYEFTDYAEERKRKDDNYVYLALADYLYDNPDYFQSLQKLHFDIGDPDLRPQPVHFEVETDQGRPVIVSALHMTDHCGLDVTLMIMADEDVLMEDITRFHNLAQDNIMSDTITTLIIVPSIGLVLLACLYIVGRGVSEPLKVMQEDVQKVKELDFNGKFDEQKPYMSELGSIARDYAGLKGVMKRFRCFVPPQIIAELVAEGGNGNGTRRIVENRYISTLFCDVANFTKVGHMCDQQLVLDFANNFLGGSADLMVKKKGTVIDFYGDQIFGIFNAPAEDPDFLVCTIETATRILELFDKVKEYFVKKDPRFAILDVRIGLHAGTALVGKIGSETRVKYCAIGENVNLGSRLEAINKRYGSRMACSSDFLFAMPRDAKRKYCIRPMEFIRVHRREAPVLIYEVAGLTSELAPEVVKEFEEHSEMFQRVKSKRVSEEELENFIKTRGKNAKFLRSGTMISDNQF